MKRTSTVQRTSKRQGSQEQLGLLDSGGLRRSAGLDGDVELADALAGTLSWASGEVDKRSRASGEDEDDADGDCAGIVLQLDEQLDPGLIAEARAAYVAELAAGRMADIARRRIEAVRLRARDLALERDPDLGLDQEYAFDPERMAVVVETGDDHAEGLLEVARRILFADRWTLLAMTQGAGLEEYGDDVHRWVADVALAIRDSRQHQLLAVVATGAEGARAALASGGLSAPLAFLAVNLGGTNVPTSVLEGVPAPPAAGPVALGLGDTRAAAVGQYKEMVASVLSDLRTAHTFSMDERIRKRAPALHDLARAITAEAGEDGPFGMQHRQIVGGWLEDAQSAAVFAADPPMGAPRYLVRIARVLGEGGASLEDGVVN